MEGEKRHAQNEEQASPRLGESQPQPTPLTGEQEREVFGARETTNQPKQSEPNQTSGEPALSEGGLLKPNEQTTPKQIAKPTNQQDPLMPRSYVGQVRSHEESVSNNVIWHKDAPNIIVISYSHDPRVEIKEYTPPKPDDSFEPKPGPLLKSIADSKLVPVYEAVNQQLHAENQVFIKKEEDRKEKNKKAVKKWRESHRKEYNTYQQGLMQERRSGNKQ
jgi:hypothetical protein